MGTLYLNNDGSRWINTNEKGVKAGMEFILVKEDGTKVKRIADYYESFGNFYSIEFRVGGVQYGGLPESFADEETGLPVVRNPVKRRRVSYK